MNSIMVDQKTGKHLQSNTPMLMGEKTLSHGYTPATDNNRQVFLSFSLKKNKTLSRNQYKVYGDKGNHLKHQQGEFLSPSFDLIVNL